MYKDIPNKNQNSVECKAISCPSDTKTIIFGQTSERNIEVTHKKRGIKQHMAQSYNHMSKTFTNEKYFLKIL